MKKSLLLMLIIFAMLSIAGCTKNKDISTSEPTKIIASKAKEMMDQDSNIIILDVRTLEEFDAGHIKGAILIPDNEINDKAESTLSDKSATILVYCRSGRRSALASQSLVDLGYSNIYDFGGIIDWPYEIVK